MFDARRLTRRALSALIVLAAAAAAAAGQPQITISPDSLEFGLMQQFQAETTVLTISNTGDAPLEISEVEVTCGCTAAEMERNTIAPGASYALDVTFNSQRFGGDTVKYILIHSNDPFNSVLEVPVHSYVHVAMKVDPPGESVNFGILNVGGTAEQTVSFSTEDVPELEITPRSWAKSLLDVEVLPSESGDPQQKRARMTVREGAPIGNFREAVVFETNVENRPKVTIEAIGQIRAPIRIKPETINLRYLQRNQQVEKIFEVGYIEGLDLEVTGAEIDLPGFEVASIENAPERRMITITVRGSAIPTSDERAIAAQGRMKGTLRVHTNLADIPELTAEMKYMLKL